MLIPRSELRPIWVSDYYDHPLEGVCFWEGQTYSFTCSPYTKHAQLTPLTRWQRFRWFKQQKLFEWCIGYHWTYRDNQRGIYKQRSPRWFWDRVFKLYYLCKRRRAARQRRTLRQHMLRAIPTCTLWVLDREDQYYRLRGTRLIVTMEEIEDAQ